MAQGNLTTNTSVVDDRIGVRSGQPFNTLAAWGAFGGGTLKVQAGYDLNGVINWVDIPNASLTATGLFCFAIAADQLRVTLSGATAPNLNWAMR